MVSSNHVQQAEQHPADMVTLPMLLSGESLQIDVLAGLIDAVVSKPLSVLQ